jgi:hypothetical protein
MKTQSILENFQSLPLHPYGDDQLNDILRAMFEDTFKLDYREEDLLALVPGNTFEVRRVYDLHVGEDHFCQLDLLCMDGEPVCFYGRHGYEDSAHPEVHYANKEKAFVLATQFAAALTNRRLQTLREQMSDAPEKLFELGGKAYIASLSDSTFGLKDDDYAGQQMMLAAPYSTWIHTKAELKQVLSFEHKRVDRGWQTVGRTADGEVLLESGKVVYQFGHLAKDREASLKEMTSPGEWLVSKEESNREGIPFAVILIRNANEWLPSQRIITFREQADYDAFMALHANALDKSVSGEFPYDTIPEKASVV